MSLYEFLIDRWDAGIDSEQAEELTVALEAGRVLFFPALDFAARAEESVLFTPSILGRAKNASFDPRTGALGGATLQSAEADVLRQLMRRFSAGAATLIDRMLPAYRGRIAQARASFRPAEIAGRVTSWRKDDTRLHVDSFPATPSGGRRILRLFTNVNPDRRPRSWRIGGAFEAVARRFEPQLQLPWPGTGRLLSVLRVTKSPRTPYDALMLQLHDAMKCDDTFQRDSEQIAFEFPSGSTWLCFSDEVSHAATAGQYQLEQTFLLPVEAMRAPERSPLRILERLKGRPLA